MLVHIFRTSCLVMAWPHNTETTYCERSDVCDHIVSKALNAGRDRNNFPSKFTAETPRAALCSPPPGEPTQTPKTLGKIERRWSRMTDPQRQPTATTPNSQIRSGPLVVRHLLLPRSHESQAILLSSLSETTAASATETACFASVSAASPPATLEGLLNLKPQNQTA